MKVELLHHTPLWICSTAIRKCWASEDKADSIWNIEKQEVIIGAKDKELIHRVGNKNKHSSTLEHLVYSFDIDGVSRALLQEKARHRIASISVKSTRYTLKELKGEKTFISLGADIHRAEKYIVKGNSYDTFIASVKALEELRLLLQAGVSNDEAKYCMPEAYKTSYVWTVNARSLQNFLALRTNKAALWEIRELAYEIFNQLPEEHKYLFKEFVYEDSKAE